MPSLGLTYDLGLEDYKNALRLHHRRRVGVRSSGEWLILCLALASTFMIVGFSGPFRLIALMPIGLIAALIIYTRWCVKRFFRGWFSGAACEMTFHDDGIRASETNVTTEYRWPSITKARSDERVLLLYLSPMKFIILPRRVPSVEQFEEVQDLVTLNVPDCVLKRTAS